MLLFFFRRKGAWIVHLEKFLKYKKLKQQDLADALDIPRNTVWRWVNKKATPSVEMLQRLADFLQISTDELLNGPAEETREFTLIYDREGELRMEVLNMAANAPEQRVMSVSPQRIAAMVNIKTANLDREEPEKIDAGRNGRAVRRGLGAAGEVEG